MWLKRTDAHVGVPIDRTARSLGQYACEVRLRSKQELLRRERLGWASTVEGAPLPHCRMQPRRPRRTTPVGT